MAGLRLLIERRPRATAWLLLLALALRLIVPAGFMPDASARGIALVACPVWSAPAGVMAHRAGHHSTDRRAPHRHSEPPCAFAGLGLPTLAAGDPSPLALPVGEVESTTTPSGRTLRFSAAERLRPPAHAPPAPV